MFKRLLFSAIIIALAAVSSYPYSFDAYNGMTGSGVLNINPTFSFWSAGGVDLQTGYGFSDHFDMLANVADVTLYQATGYNYSWIMPRYEFFSGNIAALQIQYSANPNFFALTPEYHFFYENDNLALELNVNMFLPVNATNTTNNTLSIIAAPVWKAVPNILYCFVEVDPSWCFAQGTTLNIVPGIWLGIPNTQHQFCLAATIGNVTSKPVSYSIDFWYSYSFNIVQPNTNK
jgi:hypothetical protein